MTPVTPSNGNTSNGKASEIPILPLIPEVNKHRKEDLVLFKLRADPTSADSPTHALTIPKFHGTESAREAINLDKNTRKVWIGQACANPAQKSTIVQQVVFDAALTAHQSGHDVNNEIRTANARDAAAQRGPNQGESDAQFQARVAGITADPNEEDIVAGLLQVINFVCPDKDWQKSNVTCVASAVNQLT